MKPHSAPAVFTGLSDVGASAVSLTLAMFAIAVEMSVEETDPLLQVVSVQSRHSVSHHLLLSN